MRNVLSLFIAIFMISSATRAADYVGTENCRKCHKGPKKGEIYEKWLASKHAKAYETLASDTAKKIAKIRKVADPQADLLCLKCHITHGSIKAEGVSCESCHGAGSDYFKVSIMKDRQRALDAGLLMPDSTFCQKCHNENSPTYRPLKLDEAMKKIAHPLPKKEKEETGP